MTARFWAREPKRAKHIYKNIFLGSYVQIRKVHYMNLCHICNGEIDDTTKSVYRTKLGRFAHAHCHNMSNNQAFEVNHETKVKRPAEIASASQSPSQSLFGFVSV